MIIGLVVENGRRDANLSFDLGVLKSGSVLYSCRVMKMNEFNE